MDNSKEKKYVVFLLLPLAALLLAGVKERISRASFEETEAVHIQAGEIEDATLAVGTHLIYIGGVNDELYGIALQSARESGQDRMYYKSELGDGAWYEITSAESLDDIMEEKKQVDPVVIEALFFTHHTRSDGITYDLRTGNAVPFYDIQDPYSLTGMSELSEVYNQAELLKKSGADGSLLDEFFEISAENETTNELDRTLEKLYARYEAMKAAGAPKETLDALQKIIGKTDARRKKEVCRVMQDRLSGLLDAAAETELAGNSDLMAALGSSLTELENSQREYASTLPEEGESAVSKLEYELEERLLDAIEKGDDETAAAILDQLNSLSHIAAGESISPEKEIRLLNSLLIPLAQKTYDESGSETAQNELAFYKKYSEQLAAKGQEGQREIDALYDEKQKLQSDRMSALDDEDLAEAQRLKALIEALEARIRDLEMAANGRDNETGESGTDGGSASKAIQSMKEEALSHLADEAPDLDRLSTLVDGIAVFAQTNPNLCGSSLKALYEKMGVAKFSEDTGRYDDLMGQIEEILSEHISSFTGKMDMEDVLETVKDMDGASLTGMDPAESAAALMGMAMFNEQAQDRELTEFLGAKAGSMAGEEDSFVFRQIAADPGSDYIPADLAAKYASLRYLWNDSRKRVTLAEKGNYYIFTAFSDQAERKGHKDTLPAPALYQGVVYIPQEYARQEFGCYSYRIPGTGYVVLTDDSMAGKAAEVCDALLAGGGD